MESLSAPICRGPFPWQGLLLAISLLNFWSLPTTAQLAVVSTNAAEGQDVILHIRNMPPEFTVFVWYRGEGENYKHSIACLGIFLRHRTGPAHSCREKINFDGSLLIKRVTLKYTGIYTIAVYLPGYIKEIGFGRLNVYNILHREKGQSDGSSSADNNQSVLGTPRPSPQTPPCTGGETTELFPDVLVSLPLDIKERTLPASSPFMLVTRPCGINKPNPANLLRQWSPVTCSVELPTLNITSIYFEKGSVKAHERKTPPYGEVIQTWAAKGIPVLILQRCLWEQVRGDLGSEKRCNPFPTHRPLNKDNCPSAEFFTEPVTMPTLEASSTTVMEYMDPVVLTCYTNAVSTKWFFNGMNLRLTERMMLSLDDNKLTIDPVRREDAGNYQCEVSNPISSAKSLQVELDVK
uniref:Ig-like domain-containing protein n=1 Tax=Myotis lucifugus TaxID=59463 RepID=G1NTW0_MYOLU